METNATVTPPSAEPFKTLREEVRTFCAEFPDAYWRELDAQRAYPEEFVAAMVRAGWLAALIPRRYGGLGLGLAEASVILEEVNRAGGNAGPAHAQMYVMGTILHHASEGQRQRWLPPIARGELRLQAFGITEPAAGSDTTRIETFAERHGDHYVVNGRKRFISRVQHSDLMLLLARTAPRASQERRTEGLSVFLVDLRAAGDAIKIRPLRLMMNNHATELTIENLVVPAEDRIGEEGKGFRAIIDSWNPERVLIAAECIGDGRWFVERAARYASERVVFDRKLGENQSLQFPIAQAYAQIEAADLMRFKAAALFDAGQSCGPEANMAKLLASNASWAAANACVDVYGGNGFTADGDVERKFRENRLYQVAPISNNLVLAYLGNHVLGMPRTF
jgi:acyl-CoA dehydrogenase